MIDIHLINSGIISLASQSGLLYCLAPPPPTLTGMAPLTGMTVMVCWLMKAGMEAVEGTSCKGLVLTAELPPARGPGDGT